MSNWPINLQIKNNVVTKMRPGTWYSTKGNFPMFKSLTDYLSAFEETVHQCNQTRNQSQQWKNKFKRSYRNYYGIDIDFPRWDDIKQNYGIH